MTYSTEPTTLQLPFSVHNVTKRIGTYLSNVHGRLIVIYETGPSPRNMRERGQVANGEFWPYSIDVYILRSYY